MGDMVAVCWNLKTERVKTIVAGIEYTGKRQTRYGNPYIDFVTVWQDEKTDKLYEDEDSPVNGGINIRDAKMLVIELQLAIDYMNELKNDKIGTACD